MGKRQQVARFDQSGGILLLGVTGTCHRKSTSTRGNPRHLTATCRSTRTSVMLFALAITAHESSETFANSLTTMRRTLSRALSFARDRTAATPYSMKFPSPTSIAFNVCRTHCSCRVRSAIQITHNSSTTVRILATD